MRLPHLAALSPLTAILAGVLCATLASPGLAAPPVPSTIDPAALGAETFDEGFKSFDHGVDQDMPAHPHRWRTVFGIGGSTNPENRTLVDNLEDQVYMDPKFGGLTGCPALGIDPFELRPGVLDVKVQRLNEHDQKCLGRGWSSGLLTTHFSFQQKWGYFEADMSIPLERGFWPAFWLMPTAGSWPEFGEVDVLESVGPASPGGVPLMSVNAIWKAPEDGKKKNSGGYTAPITPGFHRYGVLWRPDTVSFYFDRTLVKTVPTPPGYVKPMGMIINVAVGQKNSWPGQPDPSVNRTDLLIRHVGVWALKDGS